MSNSTITPFLMFEGNAEAAINYYLSLFDRSELISIQRYGAGEPGPEGTVLLATFSLNGQLFMCIDSPVHHGFTFTPAVSLYVTCETEPEVDRLYQGLSQGGQVLMELGAYPFSPKFCWLNDRFGVSWQLSLKQR